jgi:hypothetical protein
MSPDYLILIRSIVSAQGCNLNIDNNNNSSLSTVTIITVECGRMLCEFEIVRYGKH